MTGRPVFHAHPGREAAAAELAQTIAQRLRAATAAVGRASLVLSGGATPLPLFDHLNRQRLPWSQVTVIPTDERWVPVEHADSNEGVMRKRLLRHEAAHARLAGLYRSGLTPGAALDDINASLARVPRPFDVVVLGMGRDGHTASLFPDALDIDRCLASTAACVTPELPASATPRVSLTPRCLLDAQSLNLLFFGAEKRAVYESAVAAPTDDGYPIGQFIQQAQVPLQVHWAA